MLTNGQDLIQTNKVLKEDEATVSSEKMPEYLWQKIKDDPFTKEHLGWKLAFIQHPMYLLIDEDRGEPVVGERIPPWGAADANEYAGRVRRNLRSLDLLPGLKLNYQWSADELRSITERFPDLLDGMRRQFLKGSLDFVDGSYSQAHLQLLGSESNWRQFEYGLDVYKDLFGAKVDVYARQETGLHLQLPQILKKFDYKYLYLPSFPHIIEFVDDKIEFLCIDGNYQPVSGNEFVNAVALDGSCIPAYLKRGATSEQDWILNYQLDLSGGPRLWSHVPDLEEIDSVSFKRYDALFNFVKLSDGLDERYSKYPPDVKARVYSYWSYSEGVWAEELLRKNKIAEEYAVLAEELNSIGKSAGINIDRSPEIKENWMTILKSQHHDISWIEVTDLRRKSIDRLDSAISNFKVIMTEISEKLVEKDMHSVSVFNGLLHPRRSLVELEGKKSLGKNMIFQEFGGKSIGFLEVPAAGFKSFKEIKKSTSSIESVLPDQITTKHYTVDLSSEGLMQQVKTLSGTELLNHGQYLGGEIRARIKDSWVNNRNAQVQFFTGQVCDILIRNSKLGEIPVKEKYYFFKEEGFIKVEIEFGFNGNEVGNMWIDKTKINVYYPVKTSEIYHDIPFGFVKGRKDKPLFVTNWLYCDGLVFVNRGTVKHWVEDDLMANVLAWGSNHFTNRTHWNHWISRPQYDIHLYGKQKIEYYLIPFDGFNASKIISYVEDITAPVFITPGKGEKSFHNIDNMDLQTTTFYFREEKIWVRGYKIPSSDKSKFRDFEIFDQPLEQLIKE